MAIGFLVEPGTNPARLREGTIVAIMELKHVQSSQDLKVLEELYWHDSEAVTGLITRFHQDEFPKTINYSGREYPNVHLLSEIHSGQAKYLELVFVAVEKMDFRYLNDIFIRGRVSDLSNIIIVDSNGEEIIRAAALLYRFLDLNQQDVKNYYRGARVEV